MKGIEDTKTKLPELKNDGRMHVYLQGNHFQQNNVIIPNNNNVINIYVVYKLDPISSTRNTDYTIQNALFGAMKITKNTDSSKNNYTGCNCYVLMKAVNLVIQKDKVILIVPQMLKM